MNRYYIVCVCFYAGMMGMACSNSGGSSSDNKRKNEQEPDFVV